MQASILIYLFAAAIIRRLTQEVEPVSVARVMLLKYASVLSDPGCLAGAEQRGSAGSFPPRSLPADSPPVIYQYHCGAEAERLM